jgi:hypothetical protein
VTRSDQQVPDAVRPPDPAAPLDPPRSQAQFFVPAPEDLPPPETVFGPGRRRSAGAIPDPADRRDVHAPHTDGGYPPPDAPMFAGVPDAPVLGGVPDAPVLAGVPDPPVLAAARHAAAAPARPRRQAVDRHRLAVVYDIDGPRVRLGVAWFLGALVATLVPLPLAAAVVYAVAAGFAARQLVRAWGSVPWQADVAAGLGSVPVLAALLGPRAVVVACALGAVVAIGCACAPDGARLPGGEGRVAAAGILWLSLVPALGAASFVLVRRHSVIAALVLLVVASAYEMGDYIVGSGGSTPLEGPLAGITTATLLALPLALVLVEPYDTAGVVLLPLTALACPLGQVVASAVLPGAGAHAPALRRIDTLLLLAPVWAAAAGAL